MNICYYDTDRQELGREEIDEMLGTATAVQQEPAGLRLSGGVERGGRERC